MKRNDKNNGGEILKEMACVIMGIITFFLLVGIPIIILGSINNIGQANGEHTGIVTAVEYNHGILWGSNLAYFKTDQQSSQEDKYCIISEAVKEQLINVSKNREIVTIHYENPYWVWSWECYGGESFITKIKLSE